MGRKRIRAHANVMSDHEMDVPPSPAEMDWAVHYPAYFPSRDPACAKQVTIADIGCGFGGLSVRLASLFPDKLTIAMEIRPLVVNVVREKIDALRAETPATDASLPGPYHNVSVMRINIMKHAANCFRKGQLEKMFFLFPDPHFKKSNHRRRIINSNFLAIYAYVLREGGMLYTITDVEDLHLWMVQHLQQHPMFERVPNTEVEANEPNLFDAIKNASEEGQKVSRLSGKKFPAVFRRIHPRDKQPTEASAPVVATPCS